MTINCNRIQRKEFLIKHKYGDQAKQERFVVIFILYAFALIGAILIFITFKIC